MFLAVSCPHRAGNLRKQHPDGLWGNGIEQPKEAVNNAPCAGKVKTLLAVVYGAEERRSKYGTTCACCRCRQKRAGAFQNAAKSDGDFKPV